LRAKIARAWEKEVKKKKEGRGQYLAQQNRQRGKVRFGQTLPLKQEKYQKMGAIMGIKKGEAS